MPGQAGQPTLIPQQERDTKKGNGGRRCNYGLIRCHGVLGQRKSAGGAGAVEVRVGRGDEAWWVWAPCGDAPYFAEMFGGRLWLAGYDVGRRRRRNGKSGKADARAITDVLIFGYPNVGGIGRIQDGRSLGPFGPDSRNKPNGGCCCVRAVRLPRSRPFAS